MLNLRNEIQEIINNQRSKLESEDKAKALYMERCRLRIEAIRPVLDEILASAEKGLIKYELKENWPDHGIAILLTLGNVMLVGECTDSSNTIALGDGGYWSFWPCESVDGKETWSFNDHKSVHQWFNNIEDMFVYLIPRIAEEIAIHQYGNTM
jgi:hypothetical protein